MRYSIDEKNIAHRDVDGEVIAVNFATGAYFSMRGTAAEIWKMIAAGARAEAIEDRYRAAGSDRGAVQREINDFLAHLVDAGLILAREDDAADDADLSGVPNGADYSPPQLEKFEDMAELIMLDPVHDVSDAGWPYRPASGG